MTVKLEELNLSLVKQEYHDEYDIKIYKKNMAIYILKKK